MHLQVQAEAKVFAVSCEKDDEAFAVCLEAEKGLLNLREGNARQRIAGAGARERQLDNAGSGARRSAQCCQAAELEPRVEARRSRRSWRAGGGHGCVGSRASFAVTYPRHLYIDHNLYVGS